MASPDLESWYKSNEETTIKIWVENPEILVEKKFGVQKKSYATFRVLMKSSSGELVCVRHRFSEFETLRENLRDRYLPLGIFVPQLPAKKLINNTDSEFIKERMQGLTLFCEGIVMNPFLRHDSTFRSFMDMRSDPSGTNVGECMLGSALARLPNPSNPLVRYMVIKEEVVAMEKQSKAVLEATRSAQQAYSSMVQANTNMQSALAGWSGLEQDSVRALSGKYNGQQDPMVRDADGVALSLQRLSKFYSDQHGAICDFPDYAGALYTPAFEYEHNRCCAFLELFKYHDDLANFIDKQRSKVEKMDRTKLDKLTEANAILEEKKICLNAFYKGLLFFSVPLATRDRCHSLRRTAGYLGATSLVSSGLLQKGSLAMLRDMEINPGSAISNTSAVLEQLSVKTLDAPNELITANHWNELPRGADPCYGLLSSAMGLSVSVPTAYSSAPTAQTDDSSISALLRQAEIEKVAAREDPFEEEPPGPPAAAAVQEETPVVPERQPDQLKVNSLLGDLTGEKPSSEKSNDLWS